jgi:TIR domain
LCDNLGMPRGLELSRWQRDVKVFLCHASQDGEAAWTLCGQLLDAGFGVWLDKLCLIPGQNWEAEIRDAVGAVDAVIVMVSKSAVDKTGFVQREVRLALDAADSRPDRSIYVIPLRLDQTPVPTRLARLQYVDTNEADWFARIKYSLLACFSPSVDTIGAN